MADILAGGLRDSAELLVQQSEPTFFADG